MVSSGYVDYLAALDGALNLLEIIYKCIHGRNGHNRNAQPGLRRDRVIGLYRLRV